MSKIFKMKYAILATLMLNIIGCGAAQGVAKDSKGDDLKRGLELAETKNYAGALAQFKALAVSEASPENLVRVGYVNFLLGDVKEALYEYRKYVDTAENIHEWDRQQLLDEIERIEKALNTGEELKGANIASSRLRGEIARVRAEEAVAKEDVYGAFKQYQKASQYLPDPAYTFEAALAATRAEKYFNAEKLFKIYLSNAGVSVSRERNYAIQAEIDRLQEILDNKEPVTWESLADQVYAARAAGTDENQLVSVKPASPEEPMGVEPKLEEDIYAQEVEEDDLEEKIAPKMSAADKRRAKKEEAVRKKAERQAKAREKRDRKKAEREAALQAKKEEQARQKTDREARLTAQREELALKKAERESSLKAKLAEEQDEKEIEKAESEARIQAEKDERELQKAEKLAKLQAVKEERELKKAEKKAKIQAAKEERIRIKEEKQAAVRAEKAARKLAIAERRASLQAENDAEALAEAEEQARLQAETAEQQLAEAESKAQEQSEKDLADQKISTREAKRREIRAERAKRRAEKQERISSEREARKANVGAIRSKRETGTSSDPNEVRDDEKPWAKESADDNFAWKTVGKEKAAAKNRPGETEHKPVLALAPSSAGAGAAAVGGIGKDGRISASNAELVRFAQSSNSAVRYRAIKDLTLVGGQRVQAIIEQRLLKDSNIQVRMAAIDALSVRRSPSSIRALRQAEMTAMTSAERARIKKAVRTIMGIE
jgi:HEAT repeat protein